MSGYVIAMVMFITSYLVWLIVSEIKFRRELHKKEDFYITELHKKEDFYITMRKARETMRDDPRNVFGPNFKDDNK